MTSPLSVDSFTLLIRQPHDAPVSVTVGASHIKPRLEVLIGCKADRVVSFGMEILAGGCSLGHRRGNDRETFVGRDARRSYALGCATWNLCELGQSGA